MLEADKKPPISSLIALKPRQVLLAEQQQLQKRPKLGRTMTKKEQLQVNQNSIKPEVKPSLPHFVLSYLHKNGFSKTLKRFLKEAQIEDDGWKATSFDLEDIYSRYLESSRDADTNVKVHKEQDGNMEKDGSGLFAAPAPEETSGKKKKKNKKSEENDENAVDTYSEVEKHAVVDSDRILVTNQVTAMHSSSKDKKGKKSDLFNQSEQVTDDAVHGLKEESMKKQKDKKNKKKRKLASESIDDDEKETSVLAVVIEKKPEALEVTNGNSKRVSEGPVKSKDKKEKLKLKDGQVTKNRFASVSGPTDILLEDCTIKSKEKKRKKELLVSKKLSDNLLEVAEKETSLEKSENGANKESKKRKLSASDGSEDNPIEKLATGESKRVKTEVLEEAKVGEQQGKVKILEGDGQTDGKIKEENGHVSQKEPQESSVKQVDQSTKDDLVNNGVEKSSEPKSARKQQNGSAEPKTLNAFQRVKVDEVKFADNRLQDNSYWAKNGAEYGYGAKAQDVLGQVKGRDFRHEKTKKKRGSYRGGQIDVHSHSIKFNYSDDD